MRFIDDGLMFHPKNMEPSLDSLLKSIYPPNLTFDILQRGVVAHVPFLDVLFITLHPLRHSVYWKPTHSALYIPWHSNTPRIVKEGFGGGVVHPFFEIVLAQELLQDFLGSTERCTH